MPHYHHHNQESVQECVWLGTVLLFTTTTTTTTTTTNAVNHLLGIALSVVMMMMTTRRAISQQNVAVVGNDPETECFSSFGWWQQVVFSHLRESRSCQDPVCLEFVRVDLCVGCCCVCCCCCCGLM